MAELDPKAVWPGWETTRLIGRGSFGAVYEIERNEYGVSEKAALKVIRIPQSESDVKELYEHTRKAKACFPVGAVLTIAASGSEMILPSLPSASTSVRFLGST